MRTIEYDELVQAATKIVSANPEYNYQDDIKTLETRHLVGAGGSDDCFYRHYDSTPGCIIGHVIVAMGGSLTSVVEYDGPDMAMERAGLHIRTDDMASSHFIEKLQRRQDQGYSWGKSLQIALSSTAGR